MPLIPGIDIPTSVSGQGTQARNGQVLSGHLYNAGLEKPQILESLIVKFPNYYLTDLTEKIAGVSSADLMSDVWAWQIMDRTRKGATVTSLTGGTTTSAVLTLDITADGVNDLGYFLVGDEFRVADSGTNGRVTAVGNAGGFQTITVAKYDATAWAVATITTNNKIGHIGTGFARGSAGSGGVRSYLPGTDYNVTNIHRRGFKIERGVMSQITYVDNETWYYKNEDFEQKEFLRDFEAKVVFGKRYLDRSGVNQTRGLQEYAEGSGQSVTFSQAVGVQEADWSQLLQQLVPQQGSNDLIALCGEKILADTNHALGPNYRTIPKDQIPQQLAGLNFQSYEIMGKRVHFCYFELFSDAAVVPVVTPSSTAKDFRNYALVLDFGTVAGAGERNIQIKYRDGAKFIQKMIPGMVGDGLQSANAYDGIQGELLCEFTNVCHLPNRLGQIYANS